MRLATSEMFDPTACDNSDFGQSPSAKDLKANQRTGGSLHTCRSFRFGIDSMMEVQGTRRSMRVDLRVDAVIVKCHVDMNRPFSPRQKAGGDWLFV